MARTYVLWGCSEKAAWILFSFAGLRALYSLACARAKQPWGRLFFSGVTLSLFALFARLLMKV